MRDLLDGISVVAAIFGSIGLIAIVVSHIDGRREESLYYDRALRILRDYPGEGDALVNECMADDVLTKAEFYRLGVFEERKLLAKKSNELQQELSYRRYRQATAEKLP